MALCPNASNSTNDVPRDAKYEIRCLVNVIISISKVEEVNRAKALNKEEKIIITTVDLSHVTRHLIHEIKVSRF